MDNHTIESAFGRRSLKRRLAQSARRVSQDAWSSAYGEGRTAYCSPHLCFSGSVRREAFASNEGSMPEFQHQQVPEVLRMIGFSTAMSVKQLRNRLRLKITPLHSTRAEEDVVRHLT